MCSDAFYDTRVAIQKAAIVRERVRREQNCGNDKQQLFHFCLQLVVHEVSLVSLTRRGWQVRGP
jgi:hypothetical protein